MITEKKISVVPNFVKYLLQGAHPDVHDLVEMATFFFGLGKQNKSAC